MNFIIFDIQNHKESNKQIIYLKTMVDRSKKKLTTKTKYGAVVAPVFILAGAYFAWDYINHHLWRKNDENTDTRDSKNSIRKSLVEKRRDDNVKNTTKEASSRRSGRIQNTLSRSVSMGAIRGGKLALKRLLDLHSYSVDTSSLANAEIEFESLLSKENPDFELLQVDLHTKSSLFFLCMIKFAAIKTLIILLLAERYFEDENKWKRSKRSRDVEESIRESKKKRRERS